jgi:ribosomal protein S18 acetylase RimI-like enzyme
MAGTLARPRSRATEFAAVAPLEPRDVPALRLYGASAERALCQALEMRPGRSVWIPETREYAVLGAWRNRPEISSVDDLVAVWHADTLLRAALERCVAQGDELMLAIELESSPGRSRFERAGLEMLEEVITYEKSIARSAPPPATTLRRRPISPDDGPAIDAVVAIDQAAFPWLWQNNRAEFDVYLRTPGVEVSLIVSEMDPVAYLGVTHFPGWGHLDRIAVAPSAQGRGVGREALSLAVESMRQAGAKRAALSTQRTNLRSQRLYERSGFHRTPDLDYKLFGAWCRPEHEHSAHFP